MYVCSRMLQWSWHAKTRNFHVSQLYTLHAKFNEILLQKCTLNKVFIYSCQLNKWGKKKKMHSLNNFDIPK